MNGGGGGGGGRASPGTPPGQSQVAIGFLKNFWYGPRKKQLGPIQNCFSKEVPTAQLCNICLQLKIYHCQSGPPTPPNSTNFLDPPMEWDVNLASSHTKRTLCALIFKLVHLKTYAAISNAHLFRVCKRGKMSGSCLSTLNGFGSTQLPIFLCHIGVPTFSSQNN